MKKLITLMLLLLGGTYWGQISYADTNVATKPKQDVELTNTTTTRENKKYELTRQEEDDALGTIKVYFYDPIIEARVGLDRFILHEYNTGVVSFIITADYL
ncbi:MAG: hypothetical protein HFJ95_04100 [Muribaculaceae bacterium]|nr:hypothetical protein [Muribaculaceae bacterium]